MYPKGNVHEILYGTYSPLSDKCLSEEFCGQELTMTETVAPKFEPYYNIRYTHPQASRRVKYLEMLIQNSVTEYLNFQIQDLSNKDQKEILYALKVIKRDSVSVLKRASEIIKEHNLDLSILDAKGISYAEDLPYYESIYIFNYIVATAIYTFIEFQEQFKEYIPTGKQMSIQDFYTLEMKVAVPENIPIERTEDKPLEIKEETKHPVKPIPDTSKCKSFMLVDLTQKFSQINDLFRFLSETHHYIAADTKFTDFRKVFTGSDVTTPIIWIGTIPELTYLIKYIHNEKGYVEKTNKKHWEITCHCFRGKNGETFSKTQLNSQHFPSQESITILQKAGDLLQ